MVSRTDARRDATPALSAVLVHAALVLVANSARAQEPTNPADLVPTAPTPAKANPAASDPAPPREASPRREAAPPPDAALPEPPAKAAGVELGDIEVINVTVDRREKHIQQYAGSATAFTEHELARTGVTAVKKIADATPFVHIGVQEGNTEISIRGVGSDGNNTELGDPGTATHFDGVYIPRPRGVGSMLFDIERLEMNRGPQGTLRGRNATAGSLNIIANQPKLGEWQGQATLGFGNYSQRLATGMFNVPIGDKLAIRVAGYSEVHDPFYTNGGPVTTLAPSESADILAYRVGIRWNPTDYVTVLAGHDYAQEKGTGYGGSNFNAVLSAGMRPEDVKEPRKVVYLGAQGSQNVSHWGARLDTTLDAGPLLINYLGSYREMDYTQTTPGNGGVWYPGMTLPNLDVWNHSDWHTRSRSTVHELRMYSPDSSRLRWTLGGFYIYEHQRIFLGQVQGDTGWGWSGGEYNNTTKSWSAAGYGDATLDITSHVRATAGVRYTTEDKSRSGIGNGYGDIPGGPMRFGTEGFRWKGFDRESLTNSGTYPEIIQSGVAAWGARDNLPQLLADAPATRPSTIVDANGTYNDHFFDWRAGLDADLGPNHIVYGIASSGHRSGGFNDKVGHGLAPTYKPEGLIAFEIGSKNEFFDRKAKLNVSLFDYEYSDIQLQTVQTVTPCSRPGDPTCSGFSTAVRSNAAKARIMGVEIEGKLELPYGFVIRAEAMILDARYGTGSEARDSRVGYGVNDSPKVSLEGKWLPKTSRATFNYSLGQNVKTSVGSFDWLVSAQTRTEYYLTPFNGEGFDSYGIPNNNLYDVVPMYTRLDLGAGHTRPDGKLRFEGFVNNLTDTWYTTSIINTPGLNLRFLNPPRQFGVRVTVYM